MPRLLDYPGQMLSTEQVAAALGKSRRTIKRYIRERGFPRPSINPGKPGQRFRAALVDDWLRRAERTAGVGAG